MRKVLIASALALAFSVVAGAQVRFSPLFTDNMVLPRDAQVPVWGWADAGKTVKVTTSWDGKTYEALAGQDGKWSVTVATPGAGGPYSLRFDTGKKKHVKVLENILCGDVWLCSGQSNMEMPVHGWGSVYGYEEELAESNNYPNIRLLNVIRTFNTQEADTFEAEAGGWTVCSEKTLPLFSACGYFFGRALHQDLGVPIGLINSSYGGTNIEAWISTGVLEDLASAKQALHQGQNAVSADSVETIKRIWLQQIIAADRGMDGGKPRWTATDFDDSGWKELVVPGDVSHFEGLGGWDGVVWLRKEVEIPAAWAGKPLTLDLGAIDDDDDTYFNGVKVGSTEGYTFQRSYPVPAKCVKPGRAVVTVRLIDRRYNAGIMGEPERICVRCGDDKIVLSGNWKYKIGSSSEDATVPPATSFRVDFPHLLYNAMIHPLVPFPIKGAIWYQGENNSYAGYMYRETMPLLIRDWRDKWGYDFPFYMVQLTNFRKAQSRPGEYSEWSDVREAQDLTARIVPGAGMAVILDIGDAEDIHPRNKQEVGRRLSLLARKYAYGEDLVADSPCYDGYTLEGNTVRIRMKNVGGGLKTSDGAAVKGFEIAGGDHVFHFAQARIEGDTLVVWCEDVKYPQAVRYAWADNPVCNLVGGTGLPVGTFRTDVWPGPTFGKVTGY